MSRVVKHLSSSGPSVVLLGSPSAVWVFCSPLRYISTVPFNYVFGLWSYYFKTSKLRVNTLWEKIFLFSCFPKKYQTVFLDPSATLLCKWHKFYLAKCALCRSSGITFAINIFIYIFVLELFKKSSSCSSLSEH